MGAWGLAKEKPSLRKNVFGLPGYRSLYCETKTKKPTVTGASRYLSGLLPFALAP